MLQYLGNLPVHFWPSKQVLELGAGTGLLGIYVATQGVPNIGKLRTANQYV